MMLLTKNLIPKIKKNFFLLTTRLAKSFEHLNSSLTLTVAELGLRKAMCKQAVFAQTA